MLRVGQKIERYAVEDFLGHGAMAAVYKVRHTQLGSLHALKVLTARRPSVVERLLQEGRAQASLRHPNVVAVTDVIEADASPALVMEYVDGPTLERWMHHFRATHEECYALVRGICAGVGEAHSRGFIHRDLKPANVLLARTSRGFVPKVADFGIARLLEGRSKGMTSTEGALGTPHYMAPEQIHDASSADERSDIFSIGAIVYEVSTGARAFLGDDVLAVLNAVATGDSLPPESLVPDLPQDLLDAISRCLRQDPHDRIQSCGVLMDLLDPAVQGAITQGIALPHKDFEDAALRAAREEWLGTGSPASLRSTGPGRVVAANTLSEAETIAVPMEHPRSDEVTLSPAVSGAADTVPRARMREHTPREEEITEPLRGAPVSMVLFRRLVLSALLGIGFGLVAFLAWAVLVGFDPAPVAPDPGVPLERVIGEGDKPDPDG